MSSATDPYQGLERRLGLTRAALEAFIRHPPRRLLVQTRSPMVERDLDLLRALGERKLYRCVTTGGYLFVGHAETLFGLSDKFRMIHQNNGTAYQRDEVQE